MQRLRAIWQSGYVGRLILGSAGLGIVLMACCVLGLVLAPNAPETASTTTSTTTAPAVAQPATAETEPTEAATTAPAPTIGPPAETPTARPTRTPAPTYTPAPTRTATPTLAPLQSGGLGILRTEWEARHGAGTKDPALGYTYDGGYFVLFQNDPAGASTVWNIEQRFAGDGISLEDARAISTLLLPDDRKLIRTYTSAGGRLVDLYRSEWLKDRFPATMKLGDSDFSMWIEGEPGDFIVLYRAATGKVSSIIVAIGNNP